jgi:hypothetical protein
LVAASLAGCQSAAPTAPGALSVTGVVLTATGPSVAEVDHISLRSDDGQTLEFDVGVLDLSDGGLPAPHLREHMASGEQITVTYHVENGTNVIDRYTDAGR